MRRMFLLAALGSAIVASAANAQRPWYARDRWQLELATGAVVFECQLRSASVTICLSPRLTQLAVSRLLR